MRKSTNKTESTFYKYDVFEIEEVIGALLEECSLHYSVPNIQYMYAYDYIAVMQNGELYGYFVGVDRFCLVDGKRAKEYMLYEYAVYDVKGKKKANDALYGYLLERSEKTGCSRIICKKEGGNPMFYSYFAKKGFVDIGEYLSISLPNAQLCEKDEALLPIEGDKVTFEQLFFLREHGFEVNKENLRFVYEDAEIVLCRKSGECRFSEEFALVGGDCLVVDGQWALSVLDICSQLLREQVKETITIYLPKAKERTTTPDVLVGKRGIFIMKSPITMLERKRLLEQLEKENVLEKATLYTFSFDYETGGKTLNWYDIPLLKKEGSGVK